MKISFSAFSRTCYDSRYDADVDKLVGTLPQKQKNTQFN